MSTKDKPTPTPGYCSQTNLSPKSSITLSLFVTYTSLIANAYSLVSRALTLLSRSTHHAVISHHVDPQSFNTGSSSCVYLVLYKKSYITKSLLTTPVLQKSSVLEEIVITLIFCGTTYSTQTDPRA